MRNVLALLTVAIAMPAFATLNVSFGGSGLRTMNPGDAGTATLLVSNSGSVMVQANLTASVPAALSITGIQTAAGGGWKCSQTSSQSIACTGLIAPEEGFVPLSLSFTTPASLDGGHFELFARVDSTPPDGFSTDTMAIDVYRTFPVTTNNDGGAGSLRDAIVQANARCDSSVPCRIPFAASMTIEPLTPLPAITACRLVIDGGYSQDNPFATPAIEISGAKCTVANGLEVRAACPVTLQGLVINRFAANGVVIATNPLPVMAAPVELKGCFIGTNREGTEARPNGLRGVSVETPASETRLTDDIISGNTRSGVAVWAGTYTFLNNVRLGVGSNFESIGNGASGIFIDGGLAIISGGVIATNREFGVAIGAGAKGVGVDSTIVVNGGLPIDYGLDGPTSLDPTGRMPPVPVLFDASYDPASDKTTVHYDVPRAGLAAAQAYSVAFYTNQPDRYGHTNLYPNLALPVDPSVPVQPAVFIGDLRGQTIYAVVQHRMWEDAAFFDTSEYSAPLVIQK